MDIFRSIGNTSIQTRMTSLLMLASTLSVCMAAGILSVIGYYNLRDNMLSDLETTARLVGERNLAYISFKDVEGATANLKVLSLNPSVRKACLYDRNEKIFAFYNSDGGKESNCPEASVEATGKNDKRVFVFRHFSRTQLGGDNAGHAEGSIYLESDFRPLEIYARKQIYTLVGVLFTVMIVALALALLLQRSISLPVLQLAQLARMVTRNRDYSLRADMTGLEHQPRNEISALVEAFNSMISEIGAREKELLQKAEELSAAKNSAEAANRAKSHFLANISHELRTPLNAIIGFSSILVNQLFGPLGNSKYVEYAKDINDSGVHLLDIINDILDLSKAEAGKLSLAFEEVNVEKAIAKCVNVLAERASEGGVQMITNIPKHTPHLLADRLRFIQIILNVLSNAVKFTEPGGRVTIDVEVIRNDITLEATHFYITITDTGIGMANLDMSKAFQSFGQIDSDLNRKYEGTGLGLPLTKKLMDLHHGEIDIQSQLGQGTRVTLHFHAVPPVLGAASEVA